MARGARGAAGAQTRAEPEDAVVVARTQDLVEEAAEGRFTAPSAREGRAEQAR